MASVTMKVSNATGNVADRLGKGGKRLLLSSYDSLRINDLPLSPPPFCTPDDPSELTAARLSIEQGMSNTDGIGAIDEQLQRAIAVLSALNDLTADKAGTSSTPMTVNDVRQWRSAADMTWAALMQAHPHRTYDMHKSPGKRDGQHVRRVRRKPVPMFDSTEETEDTSSALVSPPLTAATATPSQMQLQQCQESEPFTTMLDGYELAPKFRNTLYMGTMRQMDVHHGDQEETCGQAIDNLALPSSFLQLPPAPVNSRRRSFDGSTASTGHAKFRLRTLASKSTRDLRSSRIPFGRVFVVSDDQEEAEEEEKEEEPIQSGRTSFATDAETTPSLDFSMSETSSQTHSTALSSSSSASSSSSEEYQIGASPSARPLSVKSSRRIRIPQAVKFSLDRQRWQPTKSSKKKLDAARPDADFASVVRTTNKYGQPTSSTVSAGTKDLMDFLASGPP